MKLNTHTHIDSMMIIPMDYRQGKLSQDSCPQQLLSTNKKDESWGFSKKENHNNKKASSSSSSSSIGEASTNSNGSSISFSLDTIDDASSSYSSFNSANSNGSLFDLSDLMSQLPIKRGLSNFYQGKSQSFTSLSRVGSTEELAKKRKLNKGCKTYGGGLNNNYKFYTLPKSIISKKVSRRLFSSSSFLNRKGSK